MVQPKHLHNTWGCITGTATSWSGCRTGMDRYTAGSAVDPAGPSSGSHRVRRDGSWYYDAWYCRSANRSGNAPGYRLGRLGFRLLRTAE